MATNSNSGGCLPNDMTSNKKVQCCALCKNHKDVSPKKGHQCPYRECPCLLCELTRKAQKFMRHQQRFWRHQKSKLKNYQKYSDLKVDEDLVDDNGQLKGQVCDKCRNHNHLTRKKNHTCPYITCECEFCSLTFKRRKVMKHQQRVRRSNITTKVAHDSTAEADSKDYQSDTEVLDYEKLSLLISMNSSEDAPNEYEDAMSGCSSSYSEIEMSNSEDTSSPFDSRNRASPPPLIPIDVPDADDAANEHIRAFDQHLVFRQGNNLPDQIPNSYFPYYKLEHSISSLAELDISSSSLPRYGSPIVRNDDRLNSPNLIHEKLTPPLSRSENSMSPQLGNDRLVPLNSRLDERIPSIADEYYNLRQKALLTPKSDWNSYVQPPSVFQTVARGINYPSSLESKQILTHKKKKKQSKLWV